MKSVYNRQEMQQKRQLGEETFDRKGRVKKAKTMKSGCTETCKRNFHEDKRKSIFESYHKLGDIDFQRAFTVSMMKTTDKRR